MRRLSVISILLSLCSIAAFGNTIPGPGVGDNIVLCDTNNTHCVSLTGGNVSTLASFSGTISGGGTSITLDALADGARGPGDLRASSSYSLSTPSSFFSQFQSNVQFNDDLTITSSLQAPGSVGYLVLTMTVNGSTTASGLGSAGYISQDSIGTASPTSDLRNFTGSTILLLSPIAFHYAAPFWVDFALGAGTYPGPSFLSGSADYSHTAKLTGMQVLDANMTQVSNPVFASAAGVSYSVNGVVPEPASLLLIGSGLVAGLAFRYRRR
jgi:hypothetical protein